MISPPSIAFTKLGLASHVLLLLNRRPSSRAAVCLAESHRIRLVPLSLPVPGLGPSHIDIFHGRNFTILPYWIHPVPFFPLLVSKVLCPCAVHVQYLNTKHAVFMRSRVDESMYEFRVIQRLIQSHKSATVINLVQWRPLSGPTTALCIGLH